MVSVCHDISARKRIAERLQDHVGERLGRVPVLSKVRQAPEVGPVGVLGPLSAYSTVNGNGVFCTV